MGRKGAFGGAKASQHFNNSSDCQTPQQIVAVLCVANTFSAPYHACTSRPHFHAPSLLTPSTLHSRGPCHAFSTRNDVSRLCSRGATAPCSFTIYLLCAALASHTPWSARTHHPPFAPVSPRLLLCGSLSHSLPPILSCSLSCTPLSLSPLRSFPTASHSHSLSLSLSRIKGGFGTFGVSLSPLGFEPSSAGQKRCGLSTWLRRLVICTTSSNLSYSPLRDIPCHAYLLGVRGGGLAGGVVVPHSAPPVHRHGGGASRWSSVPRRK